jgi:undecaprenyl diphosphate synthase
VCVCVVVIDTTATDMAILQFPKLVDLKATAVARWFSSSSSLPSTATSSSVRLSRMNDDADHGKVNHYWIYELPDNESQAATAATNSACWNIGHDSEYNNFWGYRSTDSILSENAASSINSAFWNQQQQCPCSEQRHHTTLLYRLLYWCKHIVFKVGRTYYAIPVALLLGTLLLGVLIGYVVGTRNGSRSSSSSSHRRSNPQIQQQQQQHNSRISSYWTAIGPFLLRHYSFVQGHLLEAIPLRYLLQYCYPPTKQQIVPSHLDSYIDNRNDSSVRQQHSSDTRCGGGTKSIGEDESECNKDEIARMQLRSSDETECESGLSPSELPHHIAVVMDGNRRYGMQQYNNALQGHWDGSNKLMQFVKWCLAEHIAILTVYAFSTENWSRSPLEVTSLMNIIIKYCDELRIEAIAKHISIHIQSTEFNTIPVHVQNVLRQLETDTYHTNPTLQMNICLSYGSRGEIVQACRSIVTEYQTGNWTSLNQINEVSMTQKLLLSSSPPDIFIRTSGEYRLSNFLLWQMAYTELFFLQKNWPEVEKEDFLQVLRSYAHCRERRFGR